MHLPTGVVNQAELADAVARAAEALDAREVRKVRFTVDADPFGRPSIFFGILLTPYASQKSRLPKVTSRISTALYDELQTYNNWGLLPYFDFTSNPAHFGKPGWV